MQAGDPNAGQLYYIDRHANRVRRINTNLGTIDTIAGSGQASYPGTGYAGENQGGLNASFDFTSFENFIGGSQPRLAQRGNTLYVSEALSRIRTVDLFGSTGSTIAGDGVPDITGDGGPAVNARFIAISDIAVHQPSGKVFVADTGNATVREFAPFGIIDRAVGTGTAGFTGDGGAANFAQIDTATALAITDTALYIATGSRIRKVNLDSSGNPGTITTVAGDGTYAHSGDGGPATAAEIGNVNALAVDAAGDVFMAEYLNNLGASIRRIDHTTGVITTIATGNWNQVTPADGQVTTTNAQLGFPVSLNVSTDGKVVTFGDRLTHQIRTLNVGGCAALNANSAFPDPQLTAAGNPSVDVSAIPAGLIPSAVTDVGATGIKHIDLGSTAVQSSPLADIALSSIGIKHIPLSTIPTTVGGGWSELLKGTSLAANPLQTITLDQVEALPTSELAADAPARTITLHDVDLSSSGIKHIAIASIALGTLGIKHIPLNATLADSDDAARFAAWCGPGGLLPTLDSRGCAGLGITADSPLLAIDIAGIGIKHIPLDSIPAKSVLLQESGIKHIGIKHIDLAAAGIKHIGIKHITTTSSGIKHIPLSSLSAPSLNAIVDCALFDCTASLATLEDAGNANAVRAAAELGDIAPSSAFDNYTLGDLAPALDNGLSFAQLLLGLVPRAALPWEDADLTTLNLGAGGAIGSPTTHQATFHVYANRPAGPITLSASLGGDLAFVPGSGRIDKTPCCVTYSADGVQSGSTVMFTSLPASAPAGFYTLHFDVAGGLQVGTFPVRVTVGPVVNGAGSTTVDSTPTVVTDVQEPTNNFAAASLEVNHLQLGHLGDGGTPQDVDLYQLPVPPIAGTVTTVTLSHLGADGDLAAFPSVTTPPLRSGGFRKIGAQLAPPETQDPDLRTSAPGGLDSSPQDIPNLFGRQPIAVSSQRGTTNEELQLVSRGEGGFYTIQVSSYGGATSPLPYLILARQQTPPGGATCLAVTTPSAVVDSLPSSLPAGTSTLFLVNEARLNAADPAQFATVMSDLANVAAQTSVHGVIVPIDASSSVQQAYSNWDQAPCNPNRANDVVNATNDVVDQLAPANSAQRSALKSIVIVGGDDQIPMGRVPDGTRKSNEADYAGDVLTANASGVPTTPNPISAALANRNILTDDPYGSFASIAWKDTALYVPDVALGRLVESPTDIAHQLEAYAPATGRINPTSSLAAGYDFLTDASQAIDTELAAAFARHGAPLTRDTLINDIWTKPQLLNKVPAAGPAPGITSLNAHFDHHQALPAAGNTTGDTSDLVTTADFTAVDRSLAGTLLFTLGCHSGLAFPNSYAGPDAGARANDWAQTFGSQNALYVANTGFGYGDSAAVALSEKLMKLYAHNLDGTASAGYALTQAKQDYLASAPVFSDYDAKVMMESTFYGIPTYAVGAPAVPPAPPAPRPVTPDPVTGLASTVVNFTPSFSLVNTTGGSYYTADGNDPAVAVGQPIQPKIQADVTQSSDLAHGALITALASTDGGLTAAFSQPTVDQAANEPVTPSLDAAFPSVLQSISTYNTASGQRQQLNLIPGQFVSNGDPTAPRAGVQRRYTSLTARVLYRPAGDTDFTAPTTTSANATSAVGGVAFDVTASDSGGTVTRVLVLYLDGTTWRSADLALSGDHWTGTGTTTHTTVDFFVQTVDASGNVGVTSNKAHNFSSTAVPTPPGNATPSVNAGGAATLTAGGTLARSGSFTDPDGSPWTATVNYGRPGDTAVPLALTGSTFVLNATYPNAGVFTATITVCDAQAACGVSTVNVSVNAGASVSVGDASVLEGGSGTRSLVFPVTLSHAATSPVTVHYAVAGITATGGNTAAGGTDFKTTSGTLTFTPAAGVGGETPLTKTVTVTVFSDTINESDETLALTLSAPTGGYTLGRAIGTGTILNDDAASGLRVGIGDTSMVEGDAGTRIVTIPVTLTGPPTAAGVTVNYTIPTTNWGKTNASGNDFGGITSGTITFTGAVTTKTISISVYGDTTNESDEPITITLTGATGATIARTTGTLTILNDD